MLSRSQVIQSAEDLGVRYADDLLGAASAAWRRRGTGQNEEAAVVGGDPLYLQDDHWPVNELGVRLSLSARVDCARLPPIESGWPHAPTWEHRRAWLDIFADREYGDATVSVIQHPAMADTPDLDGGTACTAVPCISLPTLPDEAFDDDFNARDT